MTDNMTPGQAGDVRRWRSRISSAGLRRRLSRRQASGMAELSVIVVAASLITGLFVGDGLSRTAVDIADGVTWLTDDPNGEVIQVNPATGQPEVRLRIPGANGHDLGLGQYDDQLYVIDHTSGLMSAIDVSTLVRSGERRVSTGGAAETMTDGETVFLVDRGRGTISAIDPLTGDELGRIWLEGEGLADAAIDDTGMVWSLDAAGQLTSLRWSDTSLAFDTEDVQQIDDSGPGSVLVGHEEGVTVFGPDAGIIYQIGTGHDVIASSADLLGDVSAPRQSRSDLTAAAAPDSSTVVIVANDQVREVDVEGVGCTTPGRPEVFHDRIYVPCVGEGKVIQLDADGNAAGPDIPTPGSQDPELVIDDDHLLINAQGSDTGLVVKEDGSVKTIVRSNDDVPTITPQMAAQTPIQSPPPKATPVTQVQNTPEKPQKDPAVTPDPASDKGAHEPEKGNDATTGVDKGKGGKGGGKGNGTSTAVVETPNNVPTPAPTGTVAPTPLTSPTPIATSTPSPTTTPTSTPTSTPTPTPTTTPTPTPTAPATPTPTPDIVAPTGVSATALSGGQVQIDWSHPGPAATSFDIALVGGGTLRTVSGSIRQGVVSVPVGTSARFVVTAVRDAERRVSGSSNAVTPAGRPDAPTGVSGSVATASFDARSTTATVSWGAAPDNGSAITTYTVTVTGGSPATSQSATVSTTSASFDIPCVDSGTDTCDYGQVTASVVATNNEGTGPAGSATIGAYSPGATRMPAGGFQMVTGTDDSSVYDGSGDVVLTLAPPADWQNFSGTCSWTHRGNGTRTAPRTETGNMACSELTLTLFVDNPPTLRPRTYSHSVTFHATGGQTTVSSAAHTFTVYTEGDGGCPRVCP